MPYHAFCLIYFIYTRYISHLNGVWFSSSYIAGEKKPLVDNAYTRLDYRISRNFSEDLILALLARVLRSLRLDITNNSFQMIGRAFWVIFIAKNRYHFLWQIR
jgi:hypothetical protein